MNPIQIYAVAAGGTSSLLVLVNLLPYLIPFFTRVSFFVSKHFTYPYILHRHQILGPWTRAGVVMQLTYLTLTVFCVAVFDLSWHGLQASTFAEAGQRAGTLAMVNMIPLYAGFHHAFVADLLGLPLKTIRGIHRTAGWMACGLLLLHAMAAALQASLPLSVPQNLFAVIAASLLCLLLVLLLPPFRQLSYELFLRSHQALALAALYAVWRHLPSDKPSIRYYLYTCMLVSAALFILQGVIIIIRNGVIRHHLARATIVHDEGAVKMQLHLTRPLRVEAGQYINLWIPSVSFWSFLQTHPFTVVSWAPAAQDTLDLLIEPRRGLTRELLDHAKRGYNLNPMAMFSGPHGMDVTMDKYESVLMVASGFGIAALLPYVKKLIYDYNARVGRARRIHVVWQINNRADGLPVQEMLNRALEEDKLDNGCILSLSIYVASQSSPEMPFGSRARIYPGPAPLAEIVRDELAVSHAKRPVAGLVGGDDKALEHGRVEAGEPEAGVKFLVAVSGSAAMRDELRRTVGKYLQVGVKFVQLDYQP